MHYRAVNCCTHLRTSGEITNTAGKAIGHAADMAAAQRITTFY
jgi:hypothetical protein